MRGLLPPLPLTEYAEKHWSVRGPDGRLSFNFDGHEYLRGIYADESQEIVLQKSAQCGISEWLVCRAVYLADVRRKTGLFAHPKDRQLNDFSHARVDPPIIFSEHLRSIVDGIKNVGLKSVAGTFLYFRGTQNEDQINSVDADFVFADERDRMIQSMIPKLRKRMGNSTYKHFISASVPSYPNYGIAKAFDDSDGCEWFIPCKRCNKVQVLTMENIEPATKDHPARYVCGKCKRPIDNTIPGEWVAARPDQDVRGYHLSKLMSSRVSPKEMLESAEEDKGVHFNYDLGLPHTRKGGRVDDDVLDACRGDFKLNKAGTKCFMGIDVGSKLNIVAGPAGKITWAGTVDDFEDLDPLMRSLDVGFCVVDALPETREAKRFARRFKGRVWIAYYAQAERGKPAIRLVKKKKADDTPTVLADRTQSLDDTYDLFLDRDVQIAEDCRNIPGFYAQITAPLRIERRESKTGNMIAIYDEKGNPDHYAHSANYWSIAQEIGRAKKPRVLTGGRIV